VKMSSGKRSAGRELNHDNWNDEEEGEDAGEFKKANDAELQKRVKKIAKRRLPTDSENSAPTVNPFSGFGGFKASANTSPTLPSASSSPFSFLAKIPSTVAATPKTNGQTSNEKSTQVEYLSKVKALNATFVSWIKEKTDENPICILSAIFKDYDKYLKEFEEAKKTAPKSDSEPAAPTASFSFGKPSAPTTQPTAAANSVFTSFSFGSNTTNPAQSPPKTTTIENKPAATTGFGISTSGFGVAQNSSVTSTPSFFGGLASTSTPFSFGNTVQAPKFDAPKDKTEEEAEEEPPKNEFVPVVEDDSLYSKRCKVFVKSGSDFADRGVGTLYIKKTEQSKIQLIVRADTNLGKKYTLNVNKGLTHIHDFFLIISRFCNDTLRTFNG
jgi:nuclear pore complex protein Nup50